MERWWLVGVWADVRGRNPGGGCQRQVARSALFLRNWVTFEVLPEVEFFARWLGRPILHANYMNNIYK